MDLGLRDKVALVTAASRGLGAAVAHRFALEGARVALCARDLERARATAERISQASGLAEVVGFKADVAVPGDVDALVRQTIERFERIDILIVNAGGPPAGTFDTLRPEQWEQATQLTLMSAVRLCYAVVPHMKETAGRHASRDAGPSIVFITSRSVKEPMANLILSNSIRMAVVGLSKSLSQELASSGIRVNAVAPGWTMTERVTELLTARAEANGTTPEQEAAKIVAETPLGRMGTPEEFANATVFLAPPAASYITGVTLAIDGGVTRASL
jgi:3-oxoacyl-[acyl-carrier protein] reductase